MSPWELGIEIRKPDSVASFSLPHLDGLNVSAKCVFWATSRLWERRTAQKRRFRDVGSPNPITPADSLLAKAQIL